MNLYDGITVEIDNSQDVIEITNSTEDLIIACVQRTLDMEEFEFNTMVSIILVDNATIEQMNSQFRELPWLPMYYPFRCWNTGRM